MCVVSGREKVAGLRGALALGVVTDLVLDDDLAGALLQDETHDTHDGEGRAWRTS